MTETDAATLAAAKARALGFPWDSTHLQIRRWRLWPFSPVWVVRSASTMPRAVTTFRIRETTGTVSPGQVVYLTSDRRPPHSGPRAWQSRVLLLTVTSAAAVALAARFLLGWPWWATSLLALAWAVLSPVLFARGPK